MQSLLVLRDAVSKRLPQRGRDILIVVGGVGILCGLFDITAVLANSGYSLWIFALSTLILLGMGLWCMHMMKVYNTFFGRGRPQNFTFPFFCFRFLLILSPSAVHVLWLPCCVKVFYFVWALIMLLVAGAMAFVTIPMIPIVGVYIPSSDNTGAKSATQQMFGFVFILDLLCVGILLGWCYLNYATGWTLQFVKEPASQRSVEADAEAAIKLTVDLEAP